MPMKRDWFDYMNNPEHKVRFYTHDGMTLLDEGKVIKTPYQETWTAVLGKQNLGTNWLTAQDAQDACDNTFIAIVKRFNTLRQRGR